MFSSSCGEKFEVFACKLTFKVKPHVSLWPYSARKLNEPCHLKRWRAPRVRRGLLGRVATGPGDVRRHVLRLGLGATGHGRRGARQVPLLDIYRPKSGRRSLGVEAAVASGAPTRRARSARRVYAGGLFLVKMKCDKGSRALLWPLNCGAMS